MKHTNKTLFVWLLAAMLAPAAGFAGQLGQTAQTPDTDAPKPERVRRPYRGLFGAPAGSDSKHSLDLTASVFGAYDNDVLTNGESTAVRARRTGEYGGLNAGAQYSHQGERVSAALGGGIAVNRYTARYTQNRTASMYLADGNVALKITSRTTLSGSTTFTYAPEYRLSLFLEPGSPTGVPDVFNTVAPDYDLFRSVAYRTSAVVRLSQAVGKRTSLAGWYALTDVNYDGAAYDYRSHAAGAGLTHGLTRNLGLRLGYSFATPTYAAALSPLGTQRVYNIDAGVDYSRALSLSRRTRFSFSTGSALLVTDPAAAGANQDVSYRLIGGADLTREIGRTWTAQASYRRSVDFREGFAAPFLGDGVSAGIGGLFNRRVRFTSSINYSFGTVGVGSSTRFHAYSVNSGMEFALSKVLAAFVRHVYYVYDFDARVALDPRFARTFDRQGARIGLSASFPLIR